MADETRPLSQAQRQVLGALGAVPPEHEGWLTTAELSRACGKGFGAGGSREWACGPARALTRRGLAEHYRPYWRITPAGRRALSDAGEGR